MAKNRVVGQISTIISCKKDRLTDQISHTLIIMADQTDLAALVDAMAQIELGKAQRVVEHRTEHDGSHDAPSSPNRTVPFGLRTPTDLGRGRETVIG